MNLLSKSLLGAVLIIVLLINCQKDHPIDVPLDSSPFLIQLDSINESIQDVSQVKKIPANLSSMAYTRSDKTQILSKAFTLNTFTSLDYYFTRENIDPEMVYTAKVTPLSGNPDLSVRSYKADRQPPYRMIRQNYSDGIEEVSFTKSDMNANENELNFVVQGPVGTSFMWEIYMEPKDAPDLSENIAPCLCGREETITLICENFENKTAGWVTAQSDNFMPPHDERAKDGVVLQGGAGMNSSSALSLKNSNDIQTEVNLNLLEEHDGQYVLTWNTFVPTSGTAHFIAPAQGGEFKLQGNGQGNLRLFDRYDLRFSFAPNKWVALELSFEPNRGLYRFRIGDKTYYWLVGNADNTLDRMHFMGTPSGYKIDDICFERYQ